MAKSSKTYAESAYVWEEEDCYRSLVVEGLGTKNLVAYAMRPVAGNAYFAIGDSAWILDEERARDLVDGWATVCEKSGAAWGGIETLGARS